MLKRTGQLDSTATNPFLQANALRQIILDGVRDALGTPQPEQQFCGFTNEGFPVYVYPPTQQQYEQAPVKSIETPPSTIELDLL